MQRQKTFESKKKSLQKTFGISPAGFSGEQPVKNKPTNKALADMQVENTQSKISKPKNDDSYF